MKPNKELKVGDAVRVSWRDSFTKPGWSPLDEPFDPGESKIVTQGWVVVNEQGFLGISSTIACNGTTADPINIPWFAIHEAKKLGEEWNR